MKLTVMRQYDRTPARGGISASGVSTSRITARELHAEVRRTPQSANSCRQGHGPTQPQDPVIRSLSFLLLLY